MKPKPLKNLTFPVFLLLTEDWIYEKFGAMPIFTMAAVLRPYSTNKLYTPEQFDGKVMIPFEEVKSACEFYLKYKDNPLLLVRDWEDDWDTGFEDVFEFIDNFSFWIGKNKKAWKRKKYNEWLFKLAFKDVLEG